jgi:hypothetical protein
MKEYGNTGIQKKKPRVRSGIFMLLWCRNVLYGKENGGTIACEKGFEKWRT